MLEVGNWHRTGRGRSSQLYATDQEIGEVLGKCLPQLYSPYVLMAIRRPKREIGYVQASSRHDIDEFVTLRGQGVDEFYVGSDTLTVGLQQREGLDVSDQLAINGLIRIIGSTFSPGRGWQDTTITMLPRVVNEATGEVSEYREYGRIYDLLKRTLLKMLPYATDYEGPWGPVERRDVRMSQAVVDLIAGGVQYNAKPGRDVR